MKSSSIDGDYIYEDEYDEEETTITDEYGYSRKRKDLPSRGPVTRSQRTSKRPKYTSEVNELREEIHQLMERSSQRSSQRPKRQICKPNRLSYSKSGVPDNPKPRVIIKRDSDSLQPIIMVVEESIIENTDETEMVGISEDIIRFLEITISKAVNSDHLKEVIDDVITEAICQATADEQLEQKIYENKWKHQYDKRTVNRLESEVTQLRDHIQSHTPNILKILQTPMPFEEKAKALEKLSIFEHMPEYSSTKLIYKNALNDLIEKFSQLSITEEEFQQYIELEKSLKYKFKSKLPLKYQILKKNFSCDQNKSLVLEKYYYWRDMDPGSGEYAKLREWIDWVLTIPTQEKQSLPSSYDSPSIISDYLFKIKQRLDENIHGLPEVKEQILCIINNKITNPKATGLAFALLLAHTTKASSEPNSSASVIAQYKAPACNTDNPRLILSLCGK